MCPEINKIDHSQKSSIRLNSSVNLKLIIKPAQIIFPLKTKFPKICLPENSQQSTTVQQSKLPMPTTVDE